MLSGSGQCLLYVEVSQVWPHETGIGSSGRGATA
jgi:hypothetical protein